MRYRRVGASVVLVLLLGLIGSLAGPGWNPQPLEETLVSHTEDTTIGSDVPTDPVGTYDVRSQVVDVAITDEVTVEATITEPVGAPDPRPGMVFMHGAGTATHENFADTTEQLASAGIVTMVPDKRADNYTTRDRDYVAMAEDYLASVDALRSWPGVDPARVGVYGESEGAMSAPVAAVLDPQVAFVVLVSAPVLPIREQGAFAADNYLRDVGVPGRLLRAIPRLVGGSIPGGGFDYFDFDVRPYHRQLTQPVLMVYGAADSSMPIVQGAQALMEDMEAGGDPNYTIRYYEDGNHGIRDDDGTLVPAFPRDVARWTLGLPQTASAPPTIAGAQPVQSFRADPVDRPRWYATGDMIVVVLLSGAGLLVAGSVVGVAVIVSRLRALVRSQERDGGSARMARLAAGLGMATLATWIMFASYLMGVASLALNYEQDAFLVQGGWIVVQATGVLAAVMVVLTVSALHRAPKAASIRERLGKGAAWTVLAGSVVLLLSAAYWGVYPTVL
ncbi:alpha/beta hydrolase family protein [Georgenia deserti]|uniref:Alpha/beta hydrolase family protein n=1 Tax=Georgenia deserti TaxID=2093781 RepID=A0ABW4L9A0_9MICO